jgi:bifunctional NMN adenylyltransferase/nudix hydrolase
MRVGVVIARFQTPLLHDGHRALLSAVQQRNDILVVILGVAPMLNVADPLTYSMRASVVRAWNSTTVVWGVGKYRHDRDWAAAIDSFLYANYRGADITLYGGRDSCLGHYEPYGYNKTEQLNIDAACSSTAIRAAIAEENDPTFRRGVIYGVNSVCPRVLAAVDLAIYEQDPKLIPGNYTPTTRVLLVQKQGETLWRFPGGCLDAADPTLEAGARREGYEETGVSLGDPEYVSSRRVDDWRYRGTGITVFSTLFAARYQFGSPAPRDQEIATVRWFRVGQDIIDGGLVPEHAEFYSDFADFLQKKQV